MFVFESVDEWIAITLLSGLQLTTLKNGLNSDSPGKELFMRIGSWRGIKPILVSTVVGDLLVIINIYSHGVPISLLLSASYEI